MAIIPVQKRFIENPYLVHQESTPGALKLAFPLSQDGRWSEHSPLYRKF